MLWRFRKIVAVGLALAFLLSFFTLVRIGSAGISYRKAERWVSYETLFVTQRGFPWGRSVVPTAPSGTQEKPSQAYADPTRLSSLAILYSQLAVGDAVRQLMLKDGPIHGSIEAAPVLASQSSNGDALPLVSIAAFDSSPGAAITLATRAGDALRRYIVTQQETNDIAPADRVLLTVVKEPTTAKLFQGRSKTLPIVVFVAMLAATLALAFVLENLRPRARTAAAETQLAAEELVRRTA